MLYLHLVIKAYRNYPHTPGIDAAGIIEETTGDKFKSGDEVIVTAMTWE